MIGTCNNCKAHGPISIYKNLELCVFCIKELEKKKKYGAHKLEIKEQNKDLNKDPNLSLDTYNPFGVTLFKHQRVTLKFILWNMRCFVLDDMGTGKTMTVLSACDFLFLHNKIKKVLIIAPISVMRSVWCQHILKYFPSRDFTVLYQPNKQKRLANLSLDCDFYIINTDGIKVMEKEIINKKFDIVIIDESTSYSRHTSERTKCAWRICKTIKSVIPMTGNPIPNDTIQSYAQAKLLNFNHPRYFTRFRDQLKIKLDMYNYIDTPQAIALAYSVLQPSIRHKLEDCIDLPPITYNYVDISLTKEQENHYKKMEKEYITWLDSGEVITAANSAVKTLKLLQISCGIILNKDNSYRLNHNYRLEELKNIIGQSDKVIVFAQFTESLNQLVQDFPKSKKIDGSVKERQRFDIMNEFQEGDLDLLFLQPKTVSHGVTLTSSNTIVWWGPPYSNETFVQCNRRIRRASQLRHQRVYMFRSTKAEKKVYISLRNKQAVSKALLDMAE